jgi:nitrite reductase (NO-forming)
MQNGAPDYVVFDGVANEYAGDNELTADLGQRIRLWVVNAGPNNFSAFHVAGAILDKVYPDGNPGNVLSGMQTTRFRPAAAPWLSWPSLTRAGARWSAIASPTLPKAPWP